MLWIVTSHRQTIHTRNFWAHYFRIRYYRGPAPSLLLGGWLSKVLTDVDSDFITETFDACPRSLNADLRECGELKPKSPVREDPTNSSSSLTMDRETPRSLVKVELTPGPCSISWLTPSSLRLQTSLVEYSVHSYPSSELPRAPPSSPLNPSQAQCIHESQKSQ